MTRIYSDEFGLTTINAGDQDVTYGVDDDSVTLLVSDALAGAHALIEHYRGSRTLQLHPDLKLIHEGTHINAVAQKPSRFSSDKGPVSQRFPIQEFIDIATTLPKRTTPPLWRHGYYVSVAVGHSPGMICATKLLPWLQRFREDP